jgi:hypothetical protein
MVEEAEAECKSAEPNDRLFRRVLKRPDFFKVVDPLTGAKRPQPAALSYSDGDVDGLSTYVERLLIEFGIPSEKLCSDWEKHAVVRFSVRIVQNGGATVVITPDHSDPIIGKAHASIPKPNNWKEIRLKIIQNCEYFESDPKCS